MSVSDLLRWNLKSLTPHVDLLVNIHAWDDEEYSWPTGSSSQQTAQSEDDGSLVLLHHLHHEQEGQWQGDDDQEERPEGHD